MNTKTTTIRAAGVLAAAATLGVAATAATASADRPTITVTAVTTHEALLTIGTPGDPTGNQFVSAHDLYRGGHKVGVDGASCQIIDVVPPDSLRVQCLASLSLPQGQLTGQGLVTIDEAGTSPFTLAITGGTGAYAAARGQLTVHPVDDQQSRYSITLRG